MKSIVFLLFCILSLAARAESCDSKGPNVILFTWDGVRTDEFFKGTGLFHALQLPKSERGEIFSKFWSTHAKEGVVFGKKGNYSIGSDIAISLPSYQAIMTGESTHCRKNNCENIKNQSVLESVRQSLKLEKKDVAVFASWDRMSAAVAADLGSITHGIYPETFDDGTDDPLNKQIQQESLADLPEWHGSRKDKYTFALGMHYLKTSCPRLLYISLVDSDEFGHAKKYPDYVRSLRTYDGYLDEMIDVLKKLGAYGDKTTLIVTTDHSRGVGPLWYDHGTNSNSEKNVFLYARGRGVSPVGNSNEDGNHNQLKATIEYLLGIKPTGKILPGFKVD